MTRQPASPADGPGGGGRRRTRSRRSSSVLVAFLLSEESGFINATVTPIDGGQSEQY
ncbi:hypothetical protein [Streptomyces atroolivaceus]|uniref:hypothetical protein n=1 Tax=Streptomyces atroolivaceus TaxID=66869 RepID=UPI0036B26E9C